MKLSTSAVLIGLLLLTGTAVLTARTLAMHQGTGLVKGVVADPRGYVIPGAIVIIENELTKKQVTSNQEGAYEFELPSGVYHITTNIPAYYPFRRAEFRVEPDTRLILNLSPPLRVSSAGLDVNRTGSHELVTLAPRPKYASYGVPNTKQAPSDLLIRFYKQQKRSSAITYTTVMASYNALTIYADKISLDRKTLRIWASGQVEIDDGEERVKPVQATVKFEDGKPMVTLK